MSILRIIKRLNAYKTPSKILTNYAEQNIKNLPNKQKMKIETDQRERRIGNFVLNWGALMATGMIACQFIGY